MKTILVPVDFSPISRRVVAAAVKLARTLDARVVVMHVVKLPEIVSELSPLVGEALQITAEVEKGARRTLLGWQKRLATAGAAVETICRRGFPVPTIVAVADELDAAYIVLGSHGHGALYDLVVGGTTSGVMKRAGRPLMIVPAIRAKTMHARKK